jgi:hypothetical protein
VTLPPGCSGFNMTDGTEYKARPGGSVTVSDEHAPHIRRQAGGDAGLTGHGALVHPLPAAVERVERRLREMRRPHDPRS